jgi:hypothetical protein
MNKTNDVIIAIDELILALERHSREMDRLYEKTLSVLSDHTNLVAGMSNNAVKASGIAIEAASLALGEVR